MRGRKIQILFDIIYERHYSLIFIIPYLRSKLRHNLFRIVLRLHKLTICLHNFLKLINFVIISGIFYVNKFSKFIVFNILGLKLSEIPKNQIFTWHHSKMTPKSTILFPKHQPQWVDRRDLHAKNSKKLPTFVSDLIRSTIACS